MRFPPAGQRRPRRSRSYLLTALFTFAWLAGCIGQAAPVRGPDHGFAGVFMATVLPEEILEIGDRARGEGGEFTVDGKVPPRFQATDLTPAGCDLVRKYAMTKLFIEQIAPCEALAPAPAVIEVAAAARVEGPTLASMPVN